MFDNKYFMLFILVLNSMALGSVLMAWLVSTNLPIIIFPMTIMNTVFVAVNAIKLMNRIK